MKLCFRDVTAHLTCEYTATGETCCLEICVVFHTFFYIFGINVVICILRRRFILFGRLCFVIFTIYQLQIIDILLMRASAESLLKFSHIFCNIDLL